LKAQRDKGTEERQALKDELQELKDLIKLRREELEDILKRKAVSETAYKESAQENERIYKKGKKEPAVENGPILEKENAAVDFKPAFAENGGNADVITGHDRTSSAEMRIEDLEEKSFLQPQQNGAPTFEKSQKEVIRDFAHSDDDRNGMVNSLGMIPPPRFDPSDFKAHIENENVAIKRAKEFLKKQRRTVRKKQLDLLAAHDQWKKDVSQGELHQEDVAKLDEVKSKLDEDEFEISSAMEKIRDSQGILQRKEKSIKILRKTLLGDISSDSMGSEDDTDQATNDLAADTKLHLNGHMDANQQSRDRLQNMVEKLLRSSPIERLNQRSMAAIVDQYRPKSHDNWDKVTGGSHLVGNESYERPKNWDGSPPDQSYLRGSGEAYRMDDHPMAGQHRTLREGNPLTFEQYRRPSGYNQLADTAPPLGRIDDEMSLRLSSMLRQNDAPLGRINDEVPLLMNSMRLQNDAHVKMNGTTVRNYTPLDYRRYNAWSRPDSFSLRHHPYDNATPARDRQPLMTTSGYARIDPRIQSGYERTDPRIPSVEKQLETKWGSYFGNRDQRPITTENGNHKWGYHPAKENLLRSTVNSGITKSPFNTSQRLQSHQEWLKFVRRDRKDFK